MLILGVDCGSRVTGYGLIESVGRDTQAVDYGTIRLPERLELPERLCMVAGGLRQVLDRFSPDEAAVEDVFTQKNVRSALVLAHVRGAAMLSLAEAGVPVASYSPATVKNSVVGHGSANKEQVRQMVSVLLGVRESIDPLDVSDALAVALCHANRRAAAGMGA
ncbi:MAG: crossover junction endodeoxyribonuclease RuvC [Acidobacteriia bacterium]|nr:crossover junction endodeoxyribonuclease RuvC [Terriglobia bacterium]MYG03629.1 crossover junction endodeoxyribonuclease RuvC [Terriglobia bacterium]MYK08703.1 crossover junction endodeoxyribonuclease RuvC [Terriglobia bacterium]